MERAGSKKQHLFRGDEHRVPEELRQIDHLLDIKIFFGWWKPHLNGWQNCLVMSTVAETGTSLIGVTQPDRPYMQVLNRALLIGTKNPFQALSRNK